MNPDHDQHEHELLFDEGDFGTDPAKGDKSSKRPADQPTAAEPNNPSTQAEKNQSQPQDPSHGRNVTLYDQIVMLPFRIREIRRSQSDVTNESEAPLDRWVNDLKPKSDEPGWYEQDLFFPFDKNASSQKAKNSAYDRIRYAEYVYFHPFVRAFLYPTVEDRFHAGGNEKAVKNRSLRVLKHSADVRWAAVFVRDTSEEKTDDSDDKPRIDVFLLRVRRLELYLFETRIGFVAVEFDTRLDGYSNAPDLLEKYDKPEHADAYDVHLGEKQSWFPNGSSNGLPVAKQLKDLEKNGDAAFDYTFVRSPNFAQVLLLQNTLRRGFPPYWEYDPVLQRSNVRWDCSGGKTVEAVVWLDRNGRRVFRDDEGQGDNVWKDPSQLFWSLGWRNRIEETRHSGVPVLFPWWRQLLEPMECLDGRNQQDAADATVDEDENKAYSPEETWLYQELDYDPDKRKGKSAQPGPYYALLGDDRFPCMTYLAVNDPRELDLADWMRLALADGPGDAFPYSHGLWDMAAEVWSVAEDDNGRVELEKACVAEEFRRRYCYDRYFFRKEKLHDNDDTVPEIKSTRYLCSGEVFVAVGSAKGEAKKIKLGPNEQWSLKPFALDPVSGLLGHFRYHYFKMGLIAHFHRCSLLNFEDELSIAVSEKLGTDVKEESGEDENFREMVVRIRKELIKFRFRFWFTEVSGQLQAKELFELWSGHLGTQKLFDQVNEQLNEAEEILARWTEQEHAKAERRKNSFLTLIAVVGIPMAFYGLVSQDLDGPVRWWCTVGAVIVAPLFLYLAWINGDCKRFGWSMLKLICWRGSGKEPSPHDWRHGEGFQKRVVKWLRESGSHDSRHRKGFRSGRIICASIAIAVIVMLVVFGSTGQKAAEEDSGSKTERPAATEPTNDEAIPELDPPPADGQGTSQPAPDASKDERADPDDARSLVEPEQPSEPASEPDDAERVEPKAHEDQGSNTDSRPQAAL